MQAPATEPEVAHAAPFRLARLTLTAWDMAEPRILAFALKVVAIATLVLAAPFFLVAVALLPFDFPLWWSAIPAGLGVLVLAAGTGGYLFLRERLRSLRRFVEGADTLEQAAYGVQ